MTVLGLWKKFHDAIEDEAVAWVMQTSPASQLISSHSSLGGGQVWAWVYSLFLFSTWNKCISGFTSGFVTICTLQWGELSWIKLCYDFQWLVSFTLQRTWIKLLLWNRSVFKAWQRLWCSLPYWHLRHLHWSPFCKNTKCFPSWTFLEYVPRLCFRIRWTGTGMHI